MRDAQPYSDSSFTAGKGTGLGGSSRHYDYPAWSGMRKQLEVDYVQSQSHGNYGKQFWLTDAGMDIGARLYVQAYNEANPERKLPLLDPPDLSIFNAAALGMKPGDQDDHPLYFNYHGKDMRRGHGNGSVGNNGGQKVKEWKFECPHCDMKYVKLCFNAYEYRILIRMI